MHGHVDSANHNLIVVIILRYSRILKYFLGVAVLYLSFSIFLSTFLAGGMIFPPPSGILDPCQFSSNN